MTQNPEHSVTKYLDDLKKGDEDAAQRIWERFLDRLIRLADRKLKSSPRKALNEEDVVQQAFTQFFVQVQQGRFAKLDDRDDLWQVLTMLVDRRAKDQIRKQKSEKRGGGKNRGESIFLVPGDSKRDGIAGVPDMEPTPELAAELIEQFDQRLADLKSELDRGIALGKLQGHTNQAIADDLGIGLRTVERRLGEIRSRWSKD